MSEMIERVEDAIEGELEAMLGEGHNVTAAKLARAALEAMREPTNEQRAAYFKLRRPTVATDTAAVMLDAEWEMMIDAALRP